MIENYEYDLYFNNGLVKNIVLVESSKVTYQSVEFDHSKRINAQDIIGL